MKKLLLKAAALAALAMTTACDNGGGGSTGGGESFTLEYPKPATQSKSQKEGPKCGPFAGTIYAYYSTWTLTPDCKVYMSGPYGNAKGRVTSYSDNHVSIEGCYSINGASECGKIRVYSNGRVEATSFTR